MSFKGHCISMLHHVSLVLSANHERPRGYRLGDTKLRTRDGYSVWTENGFDVAPSLAVRLGTAGVERTISRITTWLAT